MLKKTLAALALGSALFTAGQAMAADYKIDFSPRCSSISFNTWTSGGVRSSRWQSSSLWMRVRTCWKTAISAGIRSGFTG